MHLNKPNRQAAFTKIEMSVVIVCAALLVVFVIMPRIAKATTRAARVSCISNLKNIGLAFRIFATDNDGRFPWQPSPSNQPASPALLFSEAPGTPLAPAAGVARWFSVLSNELSTPRCLRCPSDPFRLTPQSNTFAFLMAPAQAAARDRAASYFIGLNANEEQPQSILGGDRNIAGPPFSLSPTEAPSQVALRIPFGVATNQTAFASANWTAEIHQNAGNLLFGDGSVQQVASPAMRGALLNAALAGTNDLDFLWPAN